MSSMSNTQLDRTSAPHLYLRPAEGLSQTQGSSSPHHVAISMDSFGPFGGATPMPARGRGGALARAQRLVGVSLRDLPRVRTTLVQGTATGASGLSKSLEGASITAVS